MKLKNKNVWFKYINISKSCCVLDKISQKRNIKQDGHKFTGPKINTRYTAFILLSMSALLMYSKYRTTVHLYVM